MATAWCGRVAQRGYRRGIELTEEQKNGIGVALNEASLVGIEVDQERRWAGVTLAVLTLPPEGGPEPQDPRVKLILSPVGRLAASLRLGHWDDPD
ncbi:MAG: hypothetical protein ACRDL0_21490, partial [Thermoleophilaceae bacterium]